MYIVKLINKVLFPGFHLTIVSIGFSGGGLAPKKQKQSNTWKRENPFFLTPTHQSLDG